MNTRQAVIPEKAVAVLRGEHDSVGEPPPLWQFAELEALAEAVHRSARIAVPFPPARHLVVALGLRLVPRAEGICHASRDPQTVVFLRHPDPRRTELSVLHGLAHAALACESAPSNESDGWILTGMLAVPCHLLALAQACPEAASLHLPRWLIEIRTGGPSLRQAERF